MYTFIVGEEVVHKFFDSFTSIDEVQKYFKLTNISSN